MNKLSVVIITYNEEKDLGRCLQSVNNIADEIIVVDSYSTDNTELIAKSFDKVKFYKHKWEGYSGQKNYANSLASNDLVFSIDADEAVSSQLEKSIEEVKKNAVRGQAFVVKRITNYCGKWIKHSGWYPDKKLRLWFKDEGRWEGKLHEKVVFEKLPEVKVLDGDLYHYSYHSISQHILQIDKFTTIGAAEAYEKGKK
jgi:glycosyltransferase involved in cell wall biosynthesis